MKSSSNSSGLQGTIAILANRSRVLLNTGNTAAAAGNGKMMMVSCVSLFQMMDREFLTRLAGLPGHGATVPFSWRAGRGRPGYCEQG